MAQTTKPFVLKDVSLLLRPAGTTGARQEFRCQLNQAELVPTAASSGGNTLSTFCEEFSDAGGNATWALSLSGFQSFADVTDFSMVSFNDEGEEYEFVLNPVGGTISATNPGFTGTVTMVATNIGGTANQYAVFTASLPVSGKPTMIVTLPTVLV